MRAPSVPPPPPPPDPRATGQAQAASNTATATTQSILNMVDQYTPEGQVRYSRIGEEQVPDGLGGMLTVPRFRADQSLSPGQQEIFNIGQETERNIAGIGRDQSERIGGLLGTPVSMDNEAVEGRLFDLGSRRLNPMFDQREENLRTRLANQGVRPGSAAYDAEMRQFGEGRNDAFNNLLLSGRGQSVQEILAERNQPINEISALLSQSQVSQPNFINTPQTGVGGVDYTGMVNNNYNQQMNAWSQQANAARSQGNAMMGGMFGLASAGLGLFSDIRLKSRIRRVGTHPLGIGVYAYDIFGRREIGVMAQELQAVKPEAVAMHPSGFLTVDYDQIGGI